MGIGDVTQPLAPAVIEAMHKAVDEMGRRETFRGYEDSGVGYEFLRKAIVDNDFGSRGVSIDLDEVFVSDGAKSDTGNMQEIFGIDNVVAVADPVYPVYVDTNVMAGRTGPAGDEGQYAGNRLYARDRGERLCPRAAGQDRRHGLPVLPEQPDGLCGDQGTTGEVGRLRPLAQGRDLLRCGLRRLHQRPGDSALDLRDRRGQGSCHRVPQLLEDGRVHRGSLCLQHCPEAAQGLYAGRQARGRQSDLEASALHEIQRRVLHHAGRAPPRSTRRRARSRFSRRSICTWPMRPRFAKA